MKKKYFLLVILSVITISSCNDDISKQIETALLLQIQQYPESRLQDIYKNFYQDRFGSEHLIKDTASVQNYTITELASMDTSYLPLVEEIGWEHNFVRVSLEALKQNNISPDLLSNAFIESVSMADATKCDKWLVEWHLITAIIEQKHIDIPNYSEDKKSIDSILQINPKATVHHSREFNNAYKPHYRIIEKSVFKKNLYKLIKG